MTSVRDARIAYLDGWRGVAIAGVLFGHFVSHAGINMGRFGVELFFVLSGRLMAQILFTNDYPLKKFYFKRFSRVWPALFVFATIVAIAVTIFHAQGNIWPAWLAAVTFTSNYASAFGYRVTWLEHVWSLCVEEHMYLLLGAMAYGFRKFNSGKKTVAITVITASVLMMLNGAIMTIVGGDYFQVYWRSDVRGASILAGAGAYLLIEGLRESGRPLPGWTSIAFGLAATALQINPVPDYIKYSIGSALLAMSIAMLPSSPHVLKQTLSIPPLTFLGLTSFSLYLWQQPLFILLTERRPFGGPASNVIMLACACALGLASYYLIESPARRALNRRIEQRL